MLWFSRPRLVSAFLFPALGTNFITFLNYLQHVVIVLRFFALLARVPQLVHVFYYNKDYMLSVQGNSPIVNKSHQIKVKINFIAAKLNTLTLTLLPNPA